MVKKYTNRNRKISISAEPTETPVTEAGASSMSFTLVEGVGNVGDITPSGNAISYSELNEQVVDKSLGNIDMGSTTFQYARDPRGQPGQEAVRAASLDGNSYVFKDEDDSGVTRYWWGFISEFSIAGGGNEDYIEVTATVTHRQRPVEVLPSS